MVQWGIDGFEVAYCARLCDLQITIAPFACSNPPAKNPLAQAGQTNGKQSFAVVAITQYTAAVLLPFGNPDQCLAGPQPAARNQRAQWASFDQTTDPAAVAGLAKSRLFRRQGLNVNDLLRRQRGELAK
jgi:hypothetical protein